MNDTLQERFERIRKEYKKGKRKLEKLHRKSKARAHVQQKLREQAGLDAELNHGFIEGPKDCLPDSGTSKFEFGNGQVLDCQPISGNTVTDIHNFDQVIPENLVLKSDKIDMSRCLDNNMLDESQDKKNCDNLNDDKLKSSTGGSILSSSRREKIQRVLSLTKYKNRNHVVKLSRKPASQHDEVHLLSSSVVDQTSNITQNDQEIVSKPSQQCIEVSTTLSNLVNQTSNIGKSDKEIVSIQSPQTVDVSPTCSSLKDQTSHIGKNDGREVASKSTPQCVDASPVSLSTEDQISNIRKNDEIVNKPSPQCFEISPMYLNSVDQIINVRKNIKETVSELTMNKCDEHDSRKEPCAIQIAPEIQTSKKITVDFDSQLDHILDSEAIIVEKRNLCDKSKKLNKRLSLTRSFSALDRSDGHCMNKNMEAADSVNATPETSLPGCLSRSPLILESDNTIEVKRSLLRTKRSLTGIRRLSPRVSSMHDNKESLYPLMNNENGLLSSMFQCLIDESKRNKNIEDFELSSDFAIKTDVSKCDNKLSRDFTQTKNESENCDEKCCDDASPISTSKVDPEIRVFADLDHVNINDRSNSQKSSSDTCLSECSETMKKVQFECFDPCKAKEPVLELCDEKYPGSLFTNMDTPTSELKLSQTENSSPTLFESPNNSLDRSTSTNADTGRCSVVSQELDNEKLQTSTAADGIVPPNKETSGATILQKEIKLGSNIFLEEKALLEIPRTEVVLSVVTAEMSLTNRTEIYIVCLCTQSLRFYCCKDSNDWYNILNHTLQPEVQMKKNSGGRLHALSIDGCLGVLLQLPKTTSTYLHLYMYRNNTIDHVLLDSINGRSVNVKCLSEGNFLASCYTSPSSSIIKYTYNSKIHDTLKILNSVSPTSHDWEKLSLDKVDGQISCLILVQNLPSALLGLTLSRKLHIWNHQHGIILCTIDVSDVCSKDIVCPAAFAEQGYLFLPVLSKKKGQEVGSVIVVNPMLSTCETLLPLAQPKHIWKGCNLASFLSDSFLCTKETTGEICIWHVYDGSLSAVLNTALSSCFTTMNDLMVLVSENVLHVYKSQIRVEGCR